MIAGLAAAGLRRKNGPSARPDKRPDQRRRFNTKRGDTFHIPLLQSAELVVISGIGVRADYDCTLEFTSVRSLREIPYSRFFPVARMVQCEQTEPLGSDLGSFLV